MNFKRPLILASNSPRRQYLLRALGYHFAIQKPFGDESFSKEIPAQEVPSYLARKKASTIHPISEEVVLTADTVVILDGQILNKPADRAEAISMLTSLAGRTHTVVTAFCLKDSSKTLCFDDMSEVTFKKIDLQEIKNYVDQFNPYDKAGAYGAQDCLPKGVNPCSQEEIDFLKRVNKMDLAEKTFTSQAVGTGILAIEKIKGSYFNVMGLPIHKVYDELEAF